MLVDPPHPFCPFVGKSTGSDETPYIRYPYQPAYPLNRPVAVPSPPKATVD